MQDAVIFRIDAVDHARVAQRTGVVGLAAAGRIKGGAIESHGYCAVVAFFQIDDGAWNSSKCESW